MNGGVAPGASAVPDPVGPLPGTPERRPRWGLVEAPALLGAAAAMARGALPPLAAVGWLLLAAAGALLAARAISRLAGLANPRPPGPARPAGRWPTAAVAMAGTLLLESAAAQLHPLAVALSPFAVGVLIVPSFARGSTLGGRAGRAAAWGLCPLGSWVAVRGAAEGPAWLLAAGTGLGAFALDGLCGGPQAATGALSEPASPAGPQGQHEGPQGHRARSLLAAAAALWLMAGWAAGRGWLYFGALAAALAVLWRVSAPGPDGPPAPRRLAPATRLATLLLLAACLVDVAG